MLLQHVPLKALVTGASGTGKSTYFSRLIFNLQNGAGNYRTVFLYDHEGEYAYRTSVQPCLTPEDLSDAINDERMLVLYDPSEMFPGDVESGFRFYCEWSFEISKLQPAPRLFCSDELQKLCTVYDLPWEFSLVIQTGRRVGLDLVCVAQQYNEVHNKLRNQITELITFRHEEALILDALAEKGLDPSTVASLPPGRFIRKNLRNGSVDEGNIFSFDNRHLQGGVSQPGAERVEMESGLFAASQDTNAPEDSVE